MMHPWFYSGFGGNHPKDDASLEAENPADVAAIVTLGGAVEDETGMEVVPPIPKMARLAES